MPIIINASSFSIALDGATCTARLLDSGTPVPFMSLYNKVADSRPRNFEPCVSARQLRPGLLRVTAANGYGTVDVSYSACEAGGKGASILFGVSDASDWLVPAADRHLMFGEFFTGVLDNRTSHPLVMGRLQGPWGIPSVSPAPMSAGFITIGATSYYNAVLNVTASDAPLLGFTIAPTAAVPSVWTAVAKQQGIEVDNPHRFYSWYWSSSKFAEGAPADTEIAYAKRLGAQMLFISGALDAQTWTFHKKKFPSGINASINAVRAAGLKPGLHTLPYPPDMSPEVAREVLVQDTIAPTYRSGNRWGAPDGDPDHRDAYDTEDMGFWWGHDMAGSVAFNGNPTHNWYGYECPQLTSGYNCSVWGSNMSLQGAHWSPVGRYRSGGAIGFDGAGVGIVRHNELFEGIRSGLTVGLVVHPTADASAPPQ
jgi:hypothetical protein